MLWVRDERRTGFKIELLRVTLRSYRRSDQQDLTMTGVLQIDSTSPEKTLKLCFAFAFAKFALHMLTAPGYGYFRDEFYYIACSEHLAFGYVDQPPLSILLLWVQRSLLGDSLYALRFLPALAGGGLVFVTGLMVRELSGRTWAHAIAMTAVLVAPEYLALNHFFSMNSFDLLFWALAFYQLFRVLRLQRTRDWTLLGVILGLGLMNKISVLWLGAGLFAALFLTDYRRMLLTPGPYIAGVLAALLFAPYLLWNHQNQWPTLEFMQNATTEKMAPGSAARFFKDQLLNLNIVSAPLWLGGLVVCFLNRFDRRLRMVAWIYVTVTAVLLLSPAARSGYLAPAYPPLFVAGSLAIERWFVRPLVPAIFICLLLLSGAVFLPLAVPVLPVESYISYAKTLGVEPSTEERKELAELPQFYADMFGWHDITSQVAAVFHNLPQNEKKNCRIFGNNYGHTGAIAFFGKKYDLPSPISSHNNYWFWGPGDYNGEVMIIVGGSKESKYRLFEDVQEAGVTSCKYCMPYENNRTIFVCRRLKQPISDVWKQVKHFD